MTSPRTRPEPSSRTPPDPYSIWELRDQFTEMRASGRYHIYFLDEPPLDWPGCDDTQGRFAWYAIDELIDGDWVRVGVGHLPKGVEID